MPTVPCPHCGQPLNPGELLGQITSQRKARTSAQNGRKGERPINPNSLRQKKLQAEGG